MKLSLIGVPTNSAGTKNGVSKSPSVLRQAGIIDALSRHCDIHDEGNVEFLEPVTQRHDKYQIIGYDSFVSMVYSVQRSVSKVLQEGRFPLVIGGDCPILLGCLAAMKDIHKKSGLFFIDGHEDAYPPQKSPSGEAADMELGFALGQNIDNLTSEFTDLLPLVDKRNVCLFGPRDKKLLHNTGVKSLTDEIDCYDDVFIHNNNIVDLTNNAIANLRTRANAWWLHVDLDVLSTDSLPAVDYQQPGGINWNELHQLTAPLLSQNECIGCNITIYNSDLDLDAHYAKRIILYLEDVISSGSKIKSK
ncbi:MAG: arginase family protein [Thaumarchaeota archaeon]|nr:arginase family protein [Nitrososphaerota archaeon]MBI3641552.1 arginase family protein [Nitrososphaerota archaeon]